MVKGEVYRLNKKILDISWPCWKGKQMVNNDWGRNSLIETSLINRN